jgi:hypothetical protein
MGDKVVDMWEEFAIKEGLETGAGYKEIFLHHKHFSLKPEKLNHFKDGESYVTFAEAVEAVRAAEKALKLKLGINPQL